MKKNLREYLLHTCSEDELRSWFDPLRLEVSREEKIVHVSFPHDFFAQWFASHVQKRFEEQLALHLGPGFAVRYQSPGLSAAAESPEPRREPVKYIDYPYGHQFTFENFLCNNKNYFPLASAREVAKQQDVIFNPFIVCGEHGSGKTHLLKSIANELSRAFGPKPIYFGTVEDLHNLYNAKSKDVLAARSFIHEHDFLIIDDFQRIARHSQLQQELIIIFNHFYDNRKQMVFSCSAKLSSYDFLDPKLKSRLEWGLIVNLKQPDLEIRIKYIESQCRLKKLDLTKDQVRTLSHRFEDFRLLQGILLKLFAFRELVRKEMTEADFEHILSHTEDRPSESLKPDYILQVVGDHFGVGVKDLQGGKRHHQIVMARQVAMYLCRQLLGSSYPALGRIFGGKDHSTVLYSVRKVEESLRDNRDMKNVLNELKKKCHSAAEK